MLTQKLDFESLRNNESELAQFYGALIYDFLQRQPNEQVDDVETIRRVLGLSEQALEQGLDWCAFNGFVTYNSTGHAKVKTSFVSAYTDQPLPFVQHMEDDVWQRILRAAEAEFSEPPVVNPPAKPVFWESLLAQKGTVLVTGLLLFVVFLLGYMMTTGGKTLFDALVYGVTCAALVAIVHHHLTTR